MTEYARILLGHDVPDAETMLLKDWTGSRSHRNGLGVISGRDAAFWDANVVRDQPGLLEELTTLATDLLTEAKERNPGNPDVSNLTLESALCTYKSWHKPNRRYPNVYSDMMYYRIKKAEARFGRNLDTLWDAREDHLPEYLRLEDQPWDPGLSPIKQNHYLDTGTPVMLEEYGITSSFQDHVDRHAYGLRKDPTWTQC